MRQIVTSTLCAFAVMVSASACERTPEYDQSQETRDQSQGTYGGSQDTYDQPRGTYSGSNDANDRVGTTGAAGMPRVADIVEDPNRYRGQTVTVEADVQEVLGPRAFSLDEDSPLAGGIDRDLLVLGKQTSNLTGIDDQWMNNKVRVTGTVGRMSLIEVERELGWDLDPQIEAEFEGAGAVMIADSVTRIQNQR